jgi:hypothetical protein
VVPTDDSPPVQAPHEPTVVPQAAAPAPRRTVWDGMQVVGLVLLAAGVAVLVVFALTLGGH